MTPPVETVGQLDRGNPAGDAVLFDNLDLTTADGHDGWMEDFGEYTQLGGVLVDRRQHVDPVRDGIVAGWAWPGCHAEIKACRLSLEA